LSPKANAIHNMNYADKQDVPADAIESKSLGGSVVGAGLVSGQTLAILVPKMGLLTLRPYSGPDT
jgi:hypothetical protein